MINLELRARDVRQLIRIYGSAVGHPTSGIVYDTIPLLGKWFLKVQRPLGTIISTLECNMMYIMLHSKVDEIFVATSSRGNGSGLQVDYGAVLKTTPYTLFRFNFKGQEDLFLKSIQIFRVYTGMLDIPVFYRSRGVSRVFGGTLPEYGVKICKF